MQVLTEESFGFLTEEACAVKIANKDVAARHAVSAANGQFQLTYHAQLLRFGQAAVAVQDIPAAIAVLSRSEEQAAIMHLKQSQCAQGGLTLYVREARGLVTIHIPVQQAWDVHRM